MGVPLTLQTHTRTHTGWRGLLPAVVIPARGMLKTKSLDFFGLEYSELTLALTLDGGDYSLRS